MCMPTILKTSRKILMERKRRRGRKWDQDATGQAWSTCPLQSASQTFSHLPLRRPLLSRPQRAAAVKMGRAEGSTSTLLLAERSAEL